MNKIKKMAATIMFAAIALPLTAQESNDGIIFMVNEPWQSVLEKAERENKLIFMDCYTTWCGPCKALSEEIFPQKEVGDFFNSNFINVKYDMEKGDGEMLNQRYKAHIPGYPTLLLINSGGEVVHQMAGYMEADKLIAGMRAGLEGRSLFNLEKKYESGSRDFETVVAYVEALDAAVQETKKAEVINEFIDNMADFSELEDPKVWSLVESNIRDPYSPVFGYVVAQIDRALPYRAKADRYKTESQLERAISSEIREIIQLCGTTDDVDTLRIMRGKMEYLKELLVSNNVKRFPNHLAKLLMFELILDEKPHELFSDLAVIRRTGLLRSETYFLTDCYAFIIGAVDNERIIRESLDKIIELQGPPNDNPTPLSSNFYDKIAAGYAKLKNPAEAEKAREEYEKRRKITHEYMVKTFPEFVKDNQE